MYKVAEKSYAKINLALNVTKTRDDGYHELDMIMVPVKLHDTVQISDLKGKKDNFVVMDDFSVKLGHTNTADTALRAVLRRVGYDKDDKFLVFIHKNIPVKAGLGGGSSNAAATMHAINKKLKLNLTKEEMLEMAEPIGSDVPFFVDPKPARCKGRGEILEPITIKNDYYVVLVKPEEGCSTKQVYEDFDKDPDYNAADIENIVKALEEGDDELLEKSMGNSLQKTAEKLVPEIINVIEILKSKGLKMVMMTGSGSAVFGLSRDKKLIKKIARELEEETNYFVEATEVIK
ncbi:MAG: 4-(cytidine 5'-diphospho)-2-C-methyl-D-erythritol kinase [Bacilli bacterium]|nr:4-(cytidine 5'-diphospho)-2-C-methyl-D-erythritol kinase [Bacilli bacterium]